MITTPTSRRRAGFGALALMLALSAGAPALAADTAPSKPDNLTTARSLIAAKNWPSAVAELRRVNDTGNADWNNLMGYSLRKSTPPDHAAAEKYYDEALRIDPVHRGALEYSGQLYLILGNLPKAEERLARLDKACTLPCEEYGDLKKAVARYKANGNKVVASP